MIANPVQTSIDTFNCPTSPAPYFLHQSASYSHNQPWFDFRISLSEPTPMPWLFPCQWNAQSLAQTPLEVFSSSTQRSDSQSLIISSRNPNPHPNPAFQGHGGVRDQVIPIKHSITLINWQTHCSIRFPLKEAKHPNAAQVEGWVMLLQTLSRILMLNSDPTSEPWRHVTPTARYGARRLWRAARRTHELYSILLFLAGFSIEKTAWWLQPSSKRLFRRKSFHDKVDSGSKSQSPSKIRGPTPGQIT